MSLHSVDNPSIATMATATTEAANMDSAALSTTTATATATTEADSKEDQHPRRRTGSTTLARITEAVVPTSVADTAKQAYARWCNYADLPHWMQDNEYIRAFYRPPTFSYRGCFATLGYIHNETGNIYSHALGAILFLVLVGVTAHMLNEQSTANWSDSLVFYVFLAGAIICLGLSATFHLFSCHSEKVSANWNRCDYIGIVALIVGSFYPFPTFRSYRAGIFIALGSSGVVPMIHALIQYGWHHIVEGASLPWIAGMGAIYIVGAVIYAARVPERWWPAFRWHHNMDPFCAIHGLRRSVIPN
ncbi:hemolysin-III related-domain-containing protein [Syncephalis plumigaleata]|nr:hemolysin-III related-domain-containing protein [Syncephalis plumigaleata]